MLVNEVKCEETADSNCVPRRCVSTKAGTGAYALQIRKIDGVHILSGRGK